MNETELRDQLAIHAPYFHAWDVFRPWKMLWHTNGECISAKAQMSYLWADAMLEARKLDFSTLVKDNKTGIKDMADGALNE